MQRKKTLRETSKEEARNALKFDRKDGMSRRAAAGRAELLANGAVDMEHGLEIENVGRRGPLSTAVTWPLADGPSVCFEFWQNWVNSGKFWRKSSEIWSNLFSKKLASILAIFEQKIELNQTDPTRTARFFFPQFSIMDSKSCAKECIV